MEAAPKRKLGKRIKGITAAARACGVGRQHLRRVLIGERESKPLLARYAAWQQANAPAANTHNPKTTP